VILFFKREFKLLPLKKKDIITLKYSAVLMSPYLDYICITRTISLFRYMCAHDAIYMFTNWETFINVSHSR